jgi:hypothetical protein
MHVFPRLGGFKTLLEADTDPLGVVVDIARMEKGGERRGAADLRDQLNKMKLHFINIL